MLDETTKNQIRNRVMLDVALCVFAVALVYLTYLAVR